MKCGFSVVKIARERMANKQVRKACKANLSVGNEQVKKKGSKIWKCITNVRRIMERTHSISFFKHYLNTEGPKENIFHQGLWEGRDGVEGLKVNGRRS